VTSLERRVAGVVLAVDATRIGYALAGLAAAEAPGRQERGDAVDRVWKGHHEECPDATDDQQHAEQRLKSQNQYDACHNGK
jgi:hypothetical protein